MATPRGMRESWSNHCFIFKTLMTAQYGFGVDVLGRRI
jgi:hypothetical protein